MARGARQGNAAENRVAREAREEGWLVASMRHSKGGGDLLFARRAGGFLSEVRLVEVKASSEARGPFADFPPADRAALLEAARLAGGSAWLAWCPRPSQPVQWFLSDKWPGR